MSESDAIAVARRVNDLFASIPFEELREAVLEAETFEDAIQALGSA